MLLKIDERILKTDALAAESALKTTPGKVSS